jgi:pyruvate kinase
MPAIECTLAEALRAAEPGHRILIDDGKLNTTVVRRESWGVVVRVTAGPEKGYKLKPEKGVNFPDTDFSIHALTDDDRAALRFVARHADAVEFSFVQSHEDVAELQEALARERPEDWHRLGMVLKIETSRAVRNLPDMLVRAAGRQPAAIMIARGDLAVEIGFVRLAEMQEQILWLGEAAHIPVIWATQVLESYLKTGVPTRGEMTDAAMAARAECVMLNKGFYLFTGIEHLDLLFGRMSEHISKKTPQLRPLQSWGPRRARPLS